MRILVENAYKFMENGQFEKAVACWQRVIQKYKKSKEENVNPNLADISTAYYQMGVCYQQLKQWDEADTAFQDGISALSTTSTMPENRNRYHKHKMSDLVQNLINSVLQSRREEQEYEDDSRYYF